MGLLNGGIECIAAADLRGPPPDAGERVLIKSPARWAAEVTPAPSIHSESSAKSRGQYFALGLSERLIFRKYALRRFSCWATGSRGQPLATTAR